ncbi:sugar kinase, partial [Pantoea sp. BS_4]
KRGQPSLPLRLNPWGACSIGVAFSPGFIDIAIIDLSGKPLIQVYEKHPENQEISLTVNQVVRMVADTLRKKRLKNSRILGIGYAVPGFLKKDGRKRQTVAWLDT